MATIAESQNRAIVTVLGTDRPGIVAAVAGCLSEHRANILDITQTILESTFTMTMVVELGEAEFATVKASLDSLAESLGVQVVIQREDVFRFMYRL